VCCVIAVVHPCATFMVHAVNSSDRMVARITIEGSQKSRTCCALRFLV
jgi:hypothetical protein